MKKELITCTVIIILVVSFSGCTSLMRKTGQLLDGTATASKKLETYTEANNNSGVTIEHRRKKDGSEFLAISIASFPNLLFQASMPDESGRIYLTSYTFLCGSVSGWNEFTMDISSGGTFRNEANNALLQINSPIEIISISSGKIRYNNKRLIEDSALRSLNNRYERILALVEWMHDQPDLPVFYNEKAFQSYWQRIILPEIVSKKKKPSSWSREDELWNREEDIRWNVTYTQNIFPEELHNYRNSGGLLRDWEEAIGWIYFEYNWNDLCNQLNTAVYLTKK